jgi:hypothetical protein
MISASTIVHQRDCFLHSSGAMAKKAKPGRMTDKELVRRLFPKRVRKLLKQALLDDGTKRKKR